MIKAQIQINRGSLIEQISGVKAVNTLARFKPSRIGQSLYFSTSADLDGFGVFTGVKTIVFVIKPTADTKLFLDNNADKLEITGSNYSGTGLTECTVNTVNTDVASFGKWQLVIAEFSAGISFATDLEIDPTAIMSLGFKILLYDEILTTEAKIWFGKTFSPTVTSGVSFFFPFSNFTKLVLPSLVLYFMVLSTSVIVPLHEARHEGQMILDSKPSCAPLGLIKITRFCFSALRNSLIEMN